jgi:tetratricopeptide (TPR) repeat protein
MALLRIRRGQFELAVEPLVSLARAGPASPSLVSACGLLALREAYLPSEVPADEREAVEVAGRAGCAAMGRKPEARQSFEEALRRLPRRAWLHYGYGIYLLQEGEAPAAIEQFKKEIEVAPEAVLPRLEIAFELMKEGRHADAQPWAEEAVRLGPGLFAAHNALGRILVETGELERGIAELETAVRLAPESPEMRVALAVALVRAGRKDDAEKQRDVYRRLQLARERNRLPAFARDDAAASETPP